MTVNNYLPAGCGFGNKRLVRFHRIIFEIGAFFRREAARTTQHLGVPAAGKGLCAVANFFVEFF